MTGTADLIIYSIVLLSLVLIIMVTRRESRPLSRKLFIGIVTATLLMLGTDLISALLDGKSGSLNRTINSISNFILHAFTTVPFAFWYSYLEFHLSGDSEKIKKGIINKLPVLCSLSLVIWNMFSGRLYYLDAANHRVMQPGVISLYFLNIVFFVAVIIKFSRYRKVIDNKTKMAFISFILFPLLSAFIQLLNPELLIIWTGSTVGLLFFFYFLEVQDLYTDYLTGLPNRRKGEELLDKEIRKQDRRFSLIMVDLDRFKDINDTYGHPEGDTALKIFSNILRGTIKSEDFIYRYAGDEFLIISACTDTDKINLIIGRLKEQLNDFNSKGIKPYKLMFSAGYTVFEHGNYHTMKELLHETDNRMYEQKKLRE